MLSQVKVIYKNKISSVSLASDIVTASINHTEEEITAYLLGVREMLERKNIPVALTYISTLIYKISDLNSKKDGTGKGSVLVAFGQLTRTPNALLFKNEKYHPFCLKKIQGQLVHLPPTDTCSKCGQIFEPSENIVREI